MGEVSRNNLRPHPSPQLTGQASFSHYRKRARLSLRLNVPNGLALMVIGFDHTFSPGLGTLPFDGSSFGAPGCFLRVRVDNTVALLTGPGTTATWTFPIPNDPGLTCLPFYNQAAVLSNGTNALGFVMSDARAAIVGQ